MDDPFAPHLPEGKGWKGKLGRVMVCAGRGYWLGVVPDADETAWVLGDGAGRPSRRRTEGEAPGVGERERRRRSGTGPPPPMPSLPGVQGQYLSV